MTVIVSIILGFAIGCFINDAITFRTGRARTFRTRVGGALIGGALIPARLAMSTLRAALVGSVVGVAIVLFAWRQFAPSPA